MQETTITERIARVVWALVHDKRTLRSCEIAELAEMSQNGAYLLMCRLSRELPLYQDYSGAWRICERNVD